MHWNLNFGLLPLISQWEFTQDLASARAALPLLEGATAWWSCFLSADNATGLLHDLNAHNPDAEHEGQLVPDPQIGLTLLLRGVSAHVDIAAALGLPQPQAALDILAHLTPFNTAVTSVPPRPPQPQPHRNFSFLPNTRLRGDDHMGTAASPADCQQQCSASSGCQCYTYCPSTAVAGCEKGPSCWFYPPAAEGSASPAANFTSGCDVLPPPSPQPNVNVTVWTAYAGASPRQSDTFAFYPTYPSEALGGLLPLLPADAAIAQASSPLYTGAWEGNRRPLDIFVAATLGIAAGASAAALPQPPNAFTSADVLAGLNAFLSSSLGRNQLALAPGGGVENAGMSRAVSEMLLGSGLLLPAGSGSSAAWYARLFPAWPGASNPASFAGLVAKGGCEYAAAMGEGGVVAASVGVAAAFPREGSAAVNCTLALPWPGAQGRVEGQCGGQPVQLVWLQVAEGPALSLLAPVGTQCSVDLK